MAYKDDENALAGMDLPTPRHLQHQQELKIPLLRYRRSSWAGLWLLILPLAFAVTLLLKYRLGIALPLLNSIESFFNYLSGNSILTYLIPVIFVGLPLIAMIINLLAFCHCGRVSEAKELTVTIKYRPLNIAIFLFSFAVLVYFLLPDALP